MSDNKLKASLAKQKNKINELKKELEETSEKKDERIRVLESQIVSLSNCLRINIEEQQKR